MTSNKPTIALQFPPEAEKIMLHTLFGQTLLEHQLTALVQAGFQQIITFLPPTADSLRDEWRRLAVSLPARLATFLIPDDTSFWSELARQAHSLPPRLVIGQGTDLSLPFTALQLTKISGSLILAATTSRTPSAFGYAKIKNHFITAISAARLPASYPLTGHLLVSTSLLASIAAASSPGQIIKTLDVIAQSDAVKPLLLENANQFPKILTSDTQEHLAAKLFALGQHFWPHGDVLPQSYSVSGTAQLEPSVYLSPEVHIGHASLITGLTYLGAGCEISPFCFLQNVILEPGCQLGPYVHLQNCYLPAKTTVTVSSAPHFTFSSPKTKVP